MREMKNSGVAWVGAMPEDWTVKRGKFTLKLLNRPVKDTDDVITCFRDGEVTLRTNRRTDGFTFSVKEIGYQGIETGDLVIHGMDGFAGSIGISDSRGKSSPVLVVCDTDENKRYIMYYLRSMAYNNVFTALSTGIRVRSCDLRWNKLAELPYILPSFIEQDKIVSAIESSTSKVDVLIANVQAQIEKLKAYTILDNSGFGRWEWSMLANEWDADALAAWGLDLPMNESEIDVDSFFDKLDKEAEKDKGEKITVSIPDEYADQKEEIKSRIEATLMGEFEGIKIK